MRSYRSIRLGILLLIPFYVLMARVAVGAPVPRGEVVAAVVEANRAGALLRQRAAAAQLAEGILKGGAQRLEHGFWFPVSGFWLLRVPMPTSWPVRLYFLNFWPLWPERFRYRMKPAISRKLAT